MRFYVSNAARECGVVNPVVAIYRNVAQTAPEAAKVYDPFVKDLMGRIDDIRAKIPTPEVQGFRALYKNVGSKVEPAGEGLVKRCFKNEKFPRYGNLVDSYNLVAMEYITPIGAHDARELEGEEAELYFKRASGNEKITPAFKEKEESIPGGDFTYGILRDGKVFDPFAWLGKKDVDSKKFQIKEDSRSILVTAIGHAETSQEHNMMICYKVFEMLKLTCPDVQMELCIPKFID